MDNCWFSSSISIPTAQKVKQKYLLFYFDIFRMKILVFLSQQSFMY